MQVVLGLGIHPLGAIECQINQPEHIEGGQRRTGYTDEPKQPAAVRGRGIRLPQNLVFGEETGEERYPGNSQRRDPFPIPTA